MGEESVFSKAGRGSPELVAVRPSLKPIEAEAQLADDDLSQHGEAADPEKVNTRMVGE